MNPSFHVVKFCDAIYMHFWKTHQGLFPLPTLELCYLTQKHTALLTGGKSLQKLFHVLKCKLNKSNEA